MDPAPDDLRSKARTLPGPVSDYSELPKWNDDGFSTRQANDVDSSDTRSLALMSYLNNFQLKLLQLRNEVFFCNSCFCGVNFRSCAHFLFSFDNEIDSQNQTLGTRKNEEAKVGSSQGLKNSLQISAPNPAQTLQSQSMEQPSSLHHSVQDHIYHVHQFPGLTLPPQFRSGKQQLKSAYLDFSKHRKAGAVSKPSTMTPQEKIEKLRRRQQMQAMLAIQKQREHYDHQISASDMTEHSQKLQSSDASSVAEQDQSQMISPPLDGHLAEEAVYYQLQDATGKCLSGL